jgi:heme O synthase-like polyprenyltransferase
VDFYGRIKMNKVYYIINIVLALLIFITYSMSIFSSDDDVSNDAKNNRLFLISFISNVALLILVLVENIFNLIPKGVL